MRNADPQSGATARLLAGFYGGLASASVPAVAVETTDVAEADRAAGLRAAPVLERRQHRHGDGRLALAVLLSGAERGRYGLNGEDGYVPPVPTVSG